MRQSGVVLATLLILAGTAWGLDDHFHEAGAPVVKLGVYRKTFVDLVVDDPAKVLRLEVTFECGAETLILFDFKEETYRTHTLAPRTLLVYVGHTYMRLPFAVDASRRKGEYEVAYQGCLCLGRSSGLWRHWTVATVSPYRLVLGDFDYAASRATFAPYALAFGGGAPEHRVRVMGHEYALRYSPWERLSRVPSLLFRNLTQLDFFETESHAHFAFDVEDVRVTLVSGLDRTLVRRTGEPEVVMGRPFSQDFALYYDAVSGALEVMPSFHQFRYGDSEPAYTYLALTVGLVLLVAWLGAVHSPEVSAGTLTALETCVVLYAGAVTLLDVYAFASYRYVAFFMGGTGTAAYLALVSGLLVATAGCAALAFEHAGRVRASVGMRRMFCETALYGAIWLVMLHGHETAAGFVIAGFVASVACVTRLVQLLVACAVGRRETAVLSSLFSLAHVLFAVLYNYAPLVDFFFFGFGDAVNSVIFMLSLFVILPSVVLAYTLVWAQFRNTIIARSKEGKLAYQRVRPLSPDALL